MRYLGIDYGDKRIGIAVSDPEGRIAFPKSALLNRGSAKIVKELKSLLAKEDVSEIVVGLPLNLDGSESDQSRKVRSFVKKLKSRVTLPVKFENEIFTTHMVESQGVEKEHRDESAAAVILQSYLDKRRR